MKKVATNTLIQCSLAYIETKHGNKYRTKFKKLNVIKTVEQVPHLFGANILYLNLQKNENSDSEYLISGILHKSSSRSQKALETKFDKENPNQNGSVSSMVSESTIPASGIPRKKVEPFFIHVNDNMSKSPKFIKCSRVYDSKAKTSKKFRKSE